MNAACQVALSTEPLPQANYALCSPSFLDLFCGRSQSLSCSKFFDASFQPHDTCKDLLLSPKLYLVTLVNVPGWNDRVVSFVTGLDSVFCGRCAETRFSLHRELELAQLVYVHRGETVQTTGWVKQARQAYCLVCFTCFAMMALLASMKFTCTHGLLVFRYSYSISPSYSISLSGMVCTFVRNLFLPILSSGT